jgi:DNA-binding response OmpR family regulator
MTQQVLVIEDERDIAELIGLHLQDHGFAVSIARDGNEGLKAAAAGPWDLVILDLRLPGIGGLDICRRLRQQSQHTPILMVTSKSSELDRVVGLEVGADDYVTKPFSILELMARVKAILRRVQQLRPEPGGEIRLGALAINPETRMASIDDRAIELTAKEFELLHHFARSPGRVFRRVELLDSVWGYGHDGYEHTVNSHINRLRAKIEQDPRRPRLIVTVWGVGYKLDARSTGRALR